VDDGSEPPVELPADLAADERVRLIRFATPRGAAAARNAGIAATGAELVAFLDDDDAWLPGKLERQLSALTAAGDSAVMVVCGFEVWDRGRLVGAALPPGDVNSGGLLAHPCVWASTVLTRRSAIDAAGGFDESLDRIEDWDLWLRLADLGEIATVPAVLVDRRWSPLPPSIARRARAQIASRLEQRLDRLPAKEAARLRAGLNIDDALILARLGDRRGAASLLLRCLRMHPRSRAAAIGLARVLAGERIWGAVARGTARARASFRRRPPRPPGPAPQWAGP